MDKLTPAVSAEILLLVDLDMWGSSQTISKLLATIWKKMESASRYGPTGDNNKNLFYDCVVKQKRPNEGTMRQLAFVKDPDGYWVEIIQNGFNV